VRLPILRYRAKVPQNAGAFFGPGNRKNQKQQRRFLWHMLRKSMSAAILSSSEKLRDLVRKHKWTA